MFNVDALIDSSEETHLAPSIFPMSCYTMWSADWENKSPQSRLSLKVNMILVAAEILSLSWGG